MYFCVNLDTTVFGDELVRDRHPLVDGDALANDRVVFHAIETNDLVSYPFFLLWKFAAGGREQTDLDMLSIRSIF